MKSQRSALLLLVAATGLSLADGPMREPKPDPVAQADDACMDKAETTAAIVECGNASYKRWDAELNRVYGEVRKKLDRQGEQALKESQQKWLAYRDADLHAIRAIYGAVQGTMYIPMSADASAALVKARVQELRTYEDLFDAQDPP
jgi:uncharacterized protein YecT (DUF1311 family)